MKKLIRPILGLSIVATMIACGGKENKKETMDTAEVAEESMEEKTVNVNASDSKVMWSGNIVGGLKSHSGNIKLTEAELMMRGDMLVGGNFTVDMKSINPTDSNYTEDKPASALVGHLSTADFFMVDSFPKAMFVIKSADRNANTVTGDLTVRGVTKEETIKDVKINTEAGTATGKLTFNRQDYGVAFDTGAKDFVLSNDIELDIMLKM